jgi:CheY-like chemotaxis protein
MKDVLRPKEEIKEGDREVATLIEAFKKGPPKPDKLPPAPPKPPDISWLRTGDYDTRAQVADVPTALVLMGEGEKKEMISKVFEELGYQVETANSAAEAMEKMKFMNYAAILLHTGFEGGSVDEAEFHDYMKKMSMTRRRHIFYVLAGPQFHTFYDLEAFSLSANLVVNEKDLGQMNVILRKGIYEYENLFGPLLVTLHESGKR